MGGNKGNKSKKSKKKLTGKERLQQLGRAPKTLGTSEAAQRFKEREAKGLDGFTGMRKVTDAERKQGKTQLTQYRDAQRKWVSDQAAKRNAAYRAEKNKSATQRQVDKDNAMYGNTFPSGSFAISEEGKKQAKENKAIQAAKSSTFNSDAALNYAKGFNLLSVANQLSPEGGLSSYYMKGAKPNMTFGQAYNLEKSMHQQTGKFNPNSKFNLAMYARGESNPFRGMPGYGTIKSLVNPRIRNINYNRMLAGKSPLSMDKVNPGGFQTAPTEFTRRVMPGLTAFLPGFNIGSRIFNEGRPDSATTKAINNIDNVNVGGLSIGFNSPESTDIGAQAGKFFTSIPGKVANLFSGEANAAESTAGGLNIGKTNTESATKSESNDLGRTLNIGDKVKVIGGLLKDVGTQAFFGNPVADGTLTGNMDFAGNLPGDKGFSNKDVQIKGAFNSAMNSEAVQQLGQGLGLPKNFKDQLKDTASAGNQYFSGMTTDRDSIYSSVSDTLRDLSSNPKLATTARFINQLTTDNPNVSDSEREKKVSIFGIDTPLTNETVADIRSAFDEKNEKFEGLSMAERGFFEGGGGNRIVSGKLTDTLRGVLSGYKGDANIGLPKGQGVTLSNLYDAAPVLASNLSDKDSLASKRINEIKRLAPGGDITTPSLIKGQLPQFGQKRTGGKGNIRMGGGNTPLSMIPDTIIPEILPLPTTTAQGGTNATDLASIQQQAYNNQMSIYGMNPNYFAQIQQPRFNRPTKRFRNVFNRGYF